MHALILAPFSNHQLARLRQSLHVAYESWMETRRLYDPDDLAARINKDRSSILVVESDFVFEETFEQVDSLKFIGICRSATNQIDVDAATNHGILVVNTPGRNAHAVAEHTLGLMLALARRIPEAHQYVKKGRWQNPAAPYVSLRGIELAGRTLGIIGLGAIGRKLARMASALEMTVLGYDPYVAQIPASVELTDLDDLLARSDFVSVHVPLTPETEGLMNSRRLHLMKPTAFLVSACDASVFEKNALVETLKSHRIAGAAFDVFETHPVSPQDHLLALDNVILSPHLGGATEETIERHSQMVTDDILRFLDGQRPLNLVNPDAWKRRD
jgi:phosphoglycerate dehydrogenase-like enzyme